MRSRRVVRLGLVHGFSTVARAASSTAVRDFRLNMVGFIRTIRADTPSKLPPYRGHEEPRVLDGNLYAGTGWTVFHDWTCGAIPRSGSSLRAATERPRRVRSQPPASRFAARNTPLVVRPAQLRARCAALPRTPRAPSSRLSPAGPTAWSRTRPRHEARPSAREPFHRFVCLLILSDCRSSVALKSSLKRPIVRWRGESLIGSRSPTGRHFCSVVRLGSSLVECPRSVLDSLETSALALAALDTRVALARYTASTSLPPTLRRAAEAALSASGPTLRAVTRPLIASDCSGR